VTGSKQLAQNDEIYEIINKLQSDQVKIFKRVVISSLFAVFGPFSPVAGFITYLAIETGVNHALEKSGKVTKRWFKRSFEKIGTAFKKLLPEDSRIRKLLNKLEEIAKELGERPEELKKRVNEEMLRFLEELEQRDKAKEKANEEIRKAIKILLSEETSEDIKKLEELFETSGYLAYEYYSILLGILTDKKCLAILEKMGGIEKTEKETLNWVKEVVGNTKRLECILEKINKKLENSIKQINEKIIRYGLNDIGFKILYLNKIEKMASEAKKSKWSCMRLEEVCAGYDAPRNITPEIEKTLKNNRNVIIYGDAGYGKSVLLKRVAIDMLQKGYLVAYADTVESAKNPKLIEILDDLKKLSKEFNGNILVVVDNVHKCPEILALAYDYDDLIYLFAARKDEFNQSRFTGRFEEYEKKIGNLKLKEFVLRKLDDKEVKSFVNKYKSLFKKNIFSINHYIKKSGGDPLVLNLLLTEENTVETFIENWIVAVSGDKIKKYLSLVLSLTHISGTLPGFDEMSLFEILERLDIVDENCEIEFEKAIKDLKGKYITKNGEYYLTRHEKLAELFLRKCRNKKVFSKKGENIYYNKIKDAADGIIRFLRKNRNETIAANFLIGLTSLKDVESLKKLVYLSSKFDKKVRGKIYLRFGVAFYYRVDWENAEKCYLKAKKIYEELARDDPDYAGTLNNLGNLYSDRGEFEKAEKCLIDSLKIYEELAREDPSTYRPYAGTLNNLGNLYSDRGEFEKAEKCYLKAKKIYEELAREDPSTYRPYYAMTLNNLGNFYRNIAKFEKAEKCLIDSLKIYEELPKDTLSAYRSDYAETLQNLGMLYLNTNPARAKEYLEKALEIYEEFASKSKLYAERAKEVKEMLKK